MAVVHSNGQDLGVEGQNVEAMNARCVAAAGELQVISQEGQLTGNYQRMTYSPAVKDHMRALYSTCALHVPCP